MPESSDSSADSPGARGAKRTRTNTRSRLIDAADRIFARGRTTAVPIDDICAEAGFTRGAFYSNFSSVDELFFAVYDTRTGSILERIVAAGGSPAGAQVPGSLEDVTNRILRVVPADEEWFALRAAYAVRRHEDPAIAESLRDHAEQFRAAIRPLLVGLLEMSGHRLTCPERRAVRVVVAAHVGAVLQGPLVDDPGQLRFDTVLAALRGVTEPGVSGPA